MALRDRLAPTAEYLTRESTLQQLADQWLADVWKSKRAVATKERYSSTVRAHVNKAVGEVRVREATVPRMQRLVDRVAESSGEGQARMLGVVLKGMFSLAVRYGAADSNIGSDLLLPTVDRGTVRAPSIDDVKLLRSLLTAYDSKTPARGNAIRDLADIGDLLIGTGGRIGEILALRWDDVDLAGRVTITGTVTRERGRGIYRQDIPKSDSSNRTLTLPTFVVDMLATRRVNAYNEWVFPSATGTLRWPENVRQQWATAVADSPVEWMTTKACRKAVATVIDAELGLEAAKDQLGQSDIGVTRRHYVARNLARPDRSELLNVFAENSE
ncbi:tyrosine-type recombinase/integrase [Leifsonella bigeumensis]|uniref:tyrosine-type recombinase/integrase n=1 Tax=Leifsonella bigeumensis TaxID=433643 RepID=UPI0031DC5B81